MSDERKPTDDAAMADILASIRRIVSEEEQRVAATSAAPPGPQGDILVLTEEMRIAPGAASDAAPEAVSPPDARSEASPQTSPSPPAPTVDAAPRVEAAASASAQEDVALDLGDLPVDEAQIADIVRAVLRDELQGDLGRAISRKIRDIAQEEIARAFEEFAAEE